MGFGLNGPVRKTADGVVGPSGKAVRVWNMTIISGGTAGKPVLRNGTDASGDAYVWAVGVANQSVTVNFEGGLRFPNGCFYDHDENASAAVVSITREF